jgi:hypothetical protein
MCDVEVCRQIENHYCRIGTETYKFKVRQLMLRPGVAPTSAPQATLEVEAFRADYKDVAVARMRITASTPQFPRVPSLLTEALEHWLLATMPSERLH